MIRQGIILEKETNSGSLDLDFYNGDFIVDNTIYQETELILNYGPGHLKQHPDLGVHIIHFNNGNYNIAFKRKIIRELLKDDFIINRITNESESISLETLNIDVS